MSCLSESFIDNCNYEPYTNQSRVNEILHIKCPIIGLIRFQMTNVDHRLSDSIDMCQRRKKLSYKIWKHRWTIISFILTLFLMVSLFLYGTLVGAGLCSNGTWNPTYNSPCPKTLALFPLFKMASRGGKMSSLY